MKVVSVRPHNLNAVFPPIAAVPVINLKRVAYRKIDGRSIRNKMLRYEIRDEKNFISKFVSRLKAHTRNPVILALVFNEVALSGEKKPKPYIPEHISSKTHIVWHNIEAAAQFKVAPIFSIADRTCACDLIACRCHQVAGCLQFMIALFVAFFGLSLKAHSQKQDG